jgi:hypothetical protein
MTTALVSTIQSRILVVRALRVILDTDLARLYGVETRVLIQAVKRNRTRFPADFMFQLAATKVENLRSQNVMSSSDGHGGRRRAPYAFTGQGVAMLSSVLRSRQAVAVNIRIMRTFVHLRELSATHAELGHRLDHLERKTMALAARHDANARATRQQLQQVFAAIHAMMEPKAPTKQPIGYVAPQVRKGPKVR